MKLHELSVKRPVCVTMVVMIFVIIGLYSINSLPIEMMPDTGLTMAIVMTNYSNVGAQEVENLVTKRIEGACASVSGVDSITSYTSEGQSNVLLEFSSGTDMDKAVRDVEESIDLISSMLPEECDDPMVIKMEFNQTTVAMMSVSYEGYDLVQTKKFVEDYVQDKLEAAEGVASVSVMGAQDRIIEVVVDPQKMFGYGLSVADLTSAISAQNMKLPAGETEGMNKNMSVRVVGEFQDISQIEDVPITTKLNQVIHISDVAKVVDTYSDENTIARLNGDNSISVSVSAESDANTVDVVDNVLRSLDDVEKQYPKFSYNVTMESASAIRESVSSVAESAIMGGILAVIVLLLFLGNIRTSLVIGIAMPVSVVTTFVGMYFAGMTLNVVSLGGLALGVGMLVDNAVVVIENITRRKNEYNEDGMTAAVSGTGEVIGAVAASVITTCIVYVPIMFIDNIMANMFKQLAFTIVFSQISSMLVTFLLIPMLASRISNTQKRHKALAWFEKLIELLYKGYDKLLRWVLKRRKRFMGAVFLLFILSIYAITQIGLELIPMSDEGSLTVSLSLPAGSKLADTDEICKIAEERIKEIPEVETVFANIGSGGMMSLGSSGNTASITVTLTDERNRTTEDVVQEVREKLSDITGATVEVAGSSAGMSMSVNELSYSFSSTDEEALEEYVIKAEEVLKGISGVSETSTSVSETQSELKIDIDSAMAAQYGLTTATISNFVKGVLDGSTASQYADGGSEYDIRVVYPDNYVEDYTKLSQIQMKAPSGMWVSLGDVANISVEQSSTTLMRSDQKRVITLSGVLHDVDIGTANAEFEKAIAQIDTPDGVTREETGTYDMMIDTMKQFLIAILLGILLMYMVMSAQFENLRQPFIILFTVPLSIIGVAVSLLVTNSNLSVLSFVGMLMLIGIIVNNAIILIDFINTRRREKPDMDRDEAVIESGIVRMRPILMTTITSVIGFLPMAITGSVMMRPLAIVLLGGLGIGALLTLFVIPTVYTIMDDIMTKRKLKKERKREKKEFKRRAREHRNVTL